MKFVEIFSDGACSGNPGPGGWGAILRCDGYEKEISGGEAHTTNNRMELTGVIQALSALKYPCKVRVTTDSRYVVDGITKGWAQGWKKRGWKKSDGKPALNPELWERLLELLAIHDVEFACLSQQTVAAFLKKQHCRKKMPYPNRGDVLFHPKKILLITHLTVSFLQNLLQTIHTLIFFSPHILYYDHFELF